MPLIEANFDEVPDEIEPISEGVHQFEIIAIPAEATIDTKNGPAKVLELQLRVVDSGPDNGRAMRDRIFFENEFGLINLKRLAKSAGLAVGPRGFDTDELLGKMVSATVRQRKLPGEDRRVSNVTRYELTH